VSQEEPQPSTGTDPASPGGRTRDWRVWALVAVVVLVMAGLLVQNIRTAGMYAGLLRADPDIAAQTPAMARFAAAAAKPVFAGHCASCHGADMKGDRNRGIPNLTDSDWLYGSGRPVEIEKTILYGIRSGLPRTWNLADMPAFGERSPYRRYKVAPLAPQDIRDVIEYLRLIERKPADQAAAARGSKVYAETGQCYDCHANDAAGDTAIGAPNLLDDIWLYGDGSRASLFKSIAHGHQGVCPSWSRRLKPGQIRALAIYISNVAKSAKPSGAQAAADGQQQGKPS
jgi:cytochrome c oxidase cbb3-type subunit 3